MTLADNNDIATQREKARSRDFPKQGSCFSKGDKIAEKVVGGYKEVENAVIGGYKKVENAFTGGYKKVGDKFVDKFLRKDGETVEDAKARIEREQAELKERQEAEAEAREQKIADLMAKQEADCIVRERKIAELGGKSITDIQAEIKAEHNL